MRASSWNQISTGLPLATPARCALSVAAKFFELGDGVSVLGQMARAGADVGEAKLVQDLAHRALVVDDAEALGDEALEVGPSPAHDAMHGSIRAGLDELGQFCLRIGREAGRVAPGPGVLKPVSTTLLKR